MKRGRKGFTIIELMVVVAFLGILASIAIPRLALAKQRSYPAAMMSDLRNLALAQEAWAAENGGGYIPSGTTDNVSATTATPILNAAGIAVFTPSAGVTIAFTAQTASATTRAGWSGVASHVSTPVKCAFYIGLQTPIAPAVQEGVPYCG